MGPLLATYERSQCLQDAWRGTILSLGLVVLLLAFGFCELGVPPWCCWPWPPGFAWTLGYATMQSELELARSGNSIIVNAVSVADNLDQVRERAARFAALPSVGLDQLGRAGPGERGDGPRRHRGGPRSLPEGL